MIVYYDSYCKLCTHSSVFWKKIDWRNRLRYSSFRDLENYPKAMAEKLHVYDRGQWFQGYDAIIAISKKLPPLWPILPILYVFKWVGLGELMYNTIAKNRKLVPVKQCGDDGCRIDS
ncbi:thiol-disulfide oxidoreductase DCC family protein [Lentibacillus salinarum]|uniref:Thiol-disulfide oxidoreductase DCC family protein n=1 Tax=Lentibacillus salinarum TaxID=446820 RepID=A0ABW3ZY83_9BACI